MIIYLFDWYEESPIHAADFCHKSNILVFVRLHSLFLKRGTKKNTHKIHDRWSQLKLQVCTVIQKSQIHLFTLYIPKKNSITPTIRSECTKVDNEVRSCDTCWPIYNDGKWVQPRWPHQSVNHTGVMVSESKKSLTAKQLAGWIQLWPHPEGGQGVMRWENERKEGEEGGEKRGAVGTGEEVSSSVFLCWSAIIKL